MSRVFQLVLCTTLFATGCCVRDDRGSSGTDYATFESQHGVLTIDLAGLRKTSQGKNLLEELNGVALQLPVPLYLDAATAADLARNRPEESFLGDSGEFELRLLLSMIRKPGYVDFHVLWAQDGIYLVAGRGED